MKKITVTAIFISMMMITMPAFGSVDLESSGQNYLSIDNASQNGLGLNSDFTTDIWVNLETLPSNMMGSGGEYAYIIRKLSSTNGFYFAFGPDDKLYCRFENGNLASQANTNDPAITSNDLGKWIHFSVSADVSGTTFTFRRNNSIINSSRVSNSARSIGNNSENFTVGSRDGTRQFLDGKIAELRIWDHVRVPNDYGERITGNETGLIAYWEFENNSLDESPNGNHLTGYNSISYSDDSPFDTPPSTPNPEECSFSTPIKYGEAEGLQGAKTYQNLFLGTNNGVPTVCVDEVGGSFIAEYEFFDNTYTPVSVYQIPDSLIISVIAYDGNGKYFEQTLNISSGARNTYPL